VAVDRRLKQRLVGAVVLVSLVVIFVPMLLEEGPVLRSGISETNIPPTPPELDDFPSRVLPLPEDPPAQPTAEPEPGYTGDTDPMGPARTAPEVEAEQPVEPAQQMPPAAPPAPQPPPPAKDSMQEPRVGISAWVVQVASFEKRENADSLVQRLRKSALDAFVEEAELGRRTWYRVRVGPELDRNEADATRDRIGEILGEAGRSAEVVRYP
jgi:DedD protein